MRFKALRHQPSDAARKSGYDNEGQLPDTLPDSRSRPEAVKRGRAANRALGWREAQAQHSQLGAWAAEGKSLTTVQSGER